MPLNYLNETAIRTPGGAATTAGSIILQGASLLWGIAAVLPAAMGRRRRDAAGSSHSHTYEDEENTLVRNVLFKVLDDLDSPSCLPLALCHATSLPDALQTPDHRALISLLSPVTTFPVAWPDITQPSAKYHYAAFVGHWAGLSGAPAQCRRVFPTCSLSGADVINLVASWKLPCNVRPDTRFTKSTITLAAYCTFGAPEAVTAQPTRPQQNTNKTRNKIGEN